jgi:hypothetical protein
MLMAPAVGARPGARGYAFALSLCNFQSVNSCGKLLVRLFPHYRRHEAWAGVDPIVASALGVGGPLCAVKHSEAKEGGPDEQ